MQLDFVSDIACPWCAVGLWSLDQALTGLPGLTVTWNALPFELNPAMAPEGEDLVAHLSAKYGSTPQQLDAVHQTLRQRGVDVGFVFGQRDRVWNTFDAHRLLYWARHDNKQKRLKRALLQAYHGAGQNPTLTGVLLACVAEAGLSVDEAREVLVSGQFSAEVRAEETRVQQLGIRSVPALIIDNRFLVSGAQTPEAYAEILNRFSKEQN
jgi:predicted DsbA family dithiol-disulfide isomerase